MTESYANSDAYPVHASEAPTEARPLSGLRRAWAQLGGKLGAGVCLLGFVVIFLGWNGAASFDRVPSQIPYLISGGVAGLALCVIGASLLVVESQRADRARLEAAIHELRTVLEATVASAGVGGGVAPVAATVPEGYVVAGSDSWHDPGCRVIAGRVEIDAVTPEEADARGLHPCRICHPDEPRRPRRQLRAR